MTLDAASLKSSLTAIAADPPGTALEAAGRWSDALQAYAAGVVPVAVPAAVVAAVATLQASLAGAFATESAAEAMDAAFLAFGAAVGVAMGPGGFTATPPASLVGFVALFESSRDTAAEGGEDVGEAIGAWMRTGSAVPIAGGSVVQWE